MEAIMTEKETFMTKSRAANAMLWVGIVSIIMLFAGLTSAYIVRQAEGNWLYFDLPRVFYVSTAIIIASSLSMAVAQRAVKKNNFSLTSIALVTTVLLGIAFCITQWLGWRELVAMNVFFAGHESNPAGSFLYVLSGVHLLHLAGGIIAVSITTVKAILKRYSSENHLGIDLAAIYWHFLDILWVYLLLFLVFIR